MALVKFELDREGVRQLLHSAEIQEICEGAAKQALQTLGPGYSFDTRSGRNRVRVEISADTPETYHRNRKHNSILKVVGSVEV